MNEEIRKVENYEIINSMHIGGKEIVIGIDMNNAEGLYYMVADCERNELFERYDNALVSDSYIDIAEIYSDRLKEQIEKLKASEINIPQGIITPDMCDSINGKDLEEQIIVIKADVLRPEYRTQAHQIVRCKGGNGSYANARGSAVFCNCFWDDKSTRFERQDSSMQWVSAYISRQEKTAVPVKNTALLNGVMLHLSQKDMQIKKINQIMLFFHRICGSD